MEQLKNIKNYIYSKGILSSIDPATMCLNGYQKGKPFKIHIVRDHKNTKRKPQIVLEYGGKRYYPKNNIVLGGILK